VELTPYAGFEVLEVFLASSPTFVRRRTCYPCGLSRVNTYT